LNWENPPVTESRGGQVRDTDPSTVHALAAQSLTSSNPAHRSPAPNLIKIKKLPAQVDAGKSAPDVFTMTLGEETIELLPFRNWGQLDLYKWAVRGKLPASPAGLEITADHIKIAGEIIATSDPEGREKLEKAFNDWLTIETKNLELARAAPKRRPAPATESAARKSQPSLAHFRVGIDKRGQVHIDCLQGAEIVTSIGLNLAGFSALFNQGLMRKPHAVDVGALHDWVELDGELFSFEHGNNDSEKLQAALNTKYLPLTTAGSGKDILVFANAASPTGFDVQFPVTIGGVLENRRRTLNEPALDLLQEPTRCGLLQPGLILKLSPPTFIFKQKTPDGGEIYLPKSPGNTVRIPLDEGRERLIDLSLPVNYSKLTVMELAAVFNHPAVNRHTTTQTEPALAAPTASAASVTLPARPGQNQSGPRQVPTVPPAVLAGPSHEHKQVEPVPPPSNAAPPLPASVPATEPEILPPIADAEKKPKPIPNSWVGPILAQAPIRFDWFATLVYAKVAQHFGNSRQGTLGPSECWFVALAETLDPEDTAFKGIFLTRKGGFGFLGSGRIARFHRGVVFLGTRNSVIEGIGVHLLGVGLDDSDHFVFIVSEQYRSSFDVPTQTMARELEYLSEAGASLLSVPEVLASLCPISILWTVQAEQPNPVEPQALESLRPEAALLT
jgi:hypothetical protein